MIEHIEVVKGPARPSMAATPWSASLNIITKKPTKKLESTLRRQLRRYEVAGNDFAGTKAKATPPLHV
jgi:outer membrane receptor for ferrienterochelin and colicin